MATVVQFVFYIPPATDEASFYLKMVDIYDLFMENNTHEGKEDYSQPRRSDYCSKTNNILGNVVYTGGGFSFRRKVIG
jgi:hypothetical protein